MSLYWVGGGWKSHCAEGRLRLMSFVKTVGGKERMGNYIPPLPRMVTRAGRLLTAIEIIALMKQRRGDSRGRWSR